MFYVSQRSVYVLNSKLRHYQDEPSLARSYTQGHSLLFYNFRYQSSVLIKHWSNRTFEHLRHLAEVDLHIKLLKWFCSLLSLCVLHHRKLFKCFIGDTSWWYIITQQLLLSPRLNYVGSYWVHPTLIDGVNKLMTNNIRSTYNCHTFMELSGQVHQTICI